MTEHVDIGPAEPSSSKGPGLDRIIDIVFVGTCLVALLGWLWFSSGLTFYNDEWGFIGAADDWSIGRLMQRHVEHWALGLRVMWNSLMSIFGLSTYMPYLATAVLFHIVTAVGIYVLARRQTVAIVALGIGVLFLFYGSGAHDLSMSFQMGWNAAAAAGTWTLVILLREPRPYRVWLAALLLLAAVATFSAIGLIFVAASAAVLLLSPPRRRDLWVIAPALVAFLLWWLNFGRVPPSEPAGIVWFIEYVVLGISNATGKVTGFGIFAGLGIAVAFGVATVANLVSRQPLRLALLAGSAGLLCQWLLVALARAGTGYHTWQESRYVYISGIFILIAFIGLIGYRRFDRLGRGARSALGVLGVGLFVIALLTNIGEAQVINERQRARADDYRAAMLLLTEYGGSPAFPADRTFTHTEDNLLRPAGPGDAARLPDSNTLAAYIERYGSPLEDPYAPRGTAIPDSAIDRLFAQSVAGSLTVDLGEMTATPSSPRIIASQDVAARESESCQATEAIGIAPRVDLEVPSGSVLTGSSSDGGRVTTSVSLRGTYPIEGPSLVLEPGQVVRIVSPDIGDDKTLGIRVGLPPLGAMLLCLEEPSAP